MNVTVTFRHMDANDAMRDLIKDKLGKVKKFLQGPVEANVVLSIERYVHACDVTISANGYTYKGREETGDMYTSIDRVVDKIERQISKSKGRARAGRASGSGNRQVS